MREWQVDVESVPLPAGQLTDKTLERFAEAAVEHAAGLGPACGIHEHRLSMIVTVDADTPDEAARIATLAFGSALAEALGPARVPLVQKVSVELDAAEPVPA